jgi:hypothetical protein
VQRPAIPLSPRPVRRVTRSRADAIRGRSPPRPAMTLTYTSSSVVVVVVVVVVNWYFVGYIDSASDERKWQPPVSPRVAHKAQAKTLQPNTESNDAQRRVRFDAAPNSPQNSSPQRNTLQSLVKSYLIHNYTDSDKNETE